MITVQRDGANVCEWRLDETEQIERHAADSLEKIAERLTQLIVDRKWERMVVFGDPQLSRPLLGQISESCLAKVEVFFEDASPEYFEERVAAILHEAQRKREVAAVRRAKELALGRSRGCLGIRDTLEALNQSRVQQLMFDSNRSISGFSTIDGQLFREKDKLAVQAGLLLQPEPKLIERMMKRAMETNAKVTPLEGRAAADLADHDGVAALLRW